MTKFLAIVALIFISLVGCQSNQTDVLQTVSSNISVSETPLSIEKLDPNWVFINRDIQWEAPPKQIEQTFKGSLNSTFVIFYPSGRFAFVSCVLYRNNKTKAIAISAGDDFSVSKGTWKQNNDGSITIVSRLTHGALGSSPEKTGKWIIRKQSTDRIANELEYDKEVYIPIPMISGFEQLSPMIADDNQ